MTDLNAGKALFKAWRSLNSLGKNALGVRGTPIISWWEMRPKWEKWGAWWTYLGTDGDVDLVEHWYCYQDRYGNWLETRERVMEEPLMLRLFYYRVGNLVCQFAWIDPKATFRSDRTIEGEKTRFKCLSTKN